MVKLTTVCLILTTSNLLIDSQFIGIAYSVDNFKDRIQISNVNTTVLSVRSAIDCTSICLHTVGCMSFFFNEVSSKCSLHAIVFTNTSGANVEAGSMYYIIEDIESTQSGKTLRDVCEEHANFSYIASTDGDSKICIFQSVETRQNHFTYNDARVACEQLGARVLQMETREKIDFVTNVLIKEVHLGSVWLGATLVNGTWRWDNSNNVINDFNWNDGEPNNGVFGIRMSKKASYKWNDTPKTKRKGYVCEIVMTS